MRANGTQFNWHARVLAGRAWNVNQACGWSRRGPVTARTGQSACSRTGLSSRGFWASDCGQGRHPPLCPQSHRYCWGPVGTVIVNDGLKSADFVMVGYLRGLWQQQQDLALVPDAQLGWWGGQCDVHPHRLCAYLQRQQRFYVSYSCFSNLTR